MLVHGNQHLSRPAEMMCMRAACQAWWDLTKHAKWQLHSMAPIANFDRWTWIGNAKFTGPMPILSVDYAKEQDLPASTEWWKLKITTIHPQGCCIESEVYPCSPFGFQRRVYYEAARRWKKDSILQLIAECIYHLSDMSHWFVSITRPSWASSMRSSSSWDCQLVCLKSQRQFRGKYSYLVHFSRLSSKQGCILQDK